MRYPANYAPTHRILTLFATDKSPRQLDVARRRRKASRGLDHFLFESDTFQHDRASTGLGNAGPVLMQITLVERGAVVKAMAICTPHPFIQIFKVRRRTCQLSQMVANISPSHSLCFS